MNDHDKKGITIKCVKPKKDGPWEKFLKNNKYESADNPKAIILCVFAAGGKSPRKTWFDRKDGVELKWRVKGKKQIRKNMFLKHILGKSCKGKKYFEFRFEKRKPEKVYIEPSIKDDIRRILIRQHKQEKCP